jgi:hypothetical protein
VAEFLFVFGYETPAQHRNNAARGWDDEDSHAVFIEASDRDSAVAWGREIAERLVNDLWNGSGPSWKDGSFAHWIEAKADVVDRARQTGVARVSVGEFPARQAPRPERRRLAFIDQTRGYGRRAPGCLGSFIGFVLLLALADYIEGTIPKPALMLVAILAGYGLIHLYGVVARRRWGVAIPDVIRVLERDLRSFRGMEAADYRLGFNPGVSFGDRVLHECLYALKWLGHLLVFAALGTALLGLLRALGIVDTVAKLG